MLSCYISWNGYDKTYEVIHENPSNNEYGYSSDCPKCKELGAQISNEMAEVNE